VSNRGNPIKATSEPRLDCLLRPLDLDEVIAAADTADLTVA
jgi:hypothetical protein